MAKTQEQTELELLQELDTATPARKTEINNILDSMQTASSPQPRSTPEREPERALSFLEGGNSRLIDLLSFAPSLVVGQDRAKEGVTKAFDLIGAAPRPSGELTLDELPYRTAGALAMDAGTLLVPSARAAQIAQRSAVAREAVMEGASGLNLTRRVLIEPMMKSPAHTALTELTGSGLAGWVGQYGITNWDLGNTGQFFAELAGGTAGGAVVPKVTILSPVVATGKAIAGLTMMGIRGLGGMMGFETSAFKNAVEQRAALNFTSAAVHDTLSGIQVLNYGQPQGVHGFSVRADQAFDDAGLDKLAQQLQSGSTRFRQEVMDVDADNLIIAQQAFEDITSYRLDLINDPDLPVSVSNMVIDKSNQLLQGLDDQITLAENILMENIQNAQSSNLDIDAISREAHASMNEVFVGHQAQKKSLYDAVDPDGTARFPTNRIKGRVTELRDESTAASRTGQTADELAMYELVDSYGKGESFQELRDLRNRLGEIQSTSSGKSAYRIGRMIDAVEETLDGIRQFTRNPNVADRYEIARAYDLGGRNMFRSGPMRGITARSTSHNATPETATMTNFILQGNGRGAAEAAEQLRSVGHNKFTQNVVDQISLLAFDMATDRKTGRVIPSKLNRFLENYESVFSVYPEARKNLTDVSTAQTYFDSLDAGRERLQSTYDNLSANLLLGDDVFDVVREAYGDTRKLRTLMEIVKDDPDATNGVIEAFWTNILNQTEGTGTGLNSSIFYKPEQFLSVINENMAQMRILGYNTTHIRQLQQLARESVTASKNNYRDGGNITIQSEEGSILPARILLSRLWAANRTIVSPQFTMLSLGATAGVNVMANLMDNQVMALLERSLVDPKVARKLATLVTEHNDETFRNFIGVTLAEIGLPLSPFQLEVKEDENNTE